MLFIVSATKNKSLKERKKLMTTLVKFHAEYVGKISRPKKVCKKKKIIKKEKNN